MMVILVNQSNRLRKSNQRSNQRNSHHSKNKNKLMVIHLEISQISHQHLSQKRTKFQKRLKKVSLDHQRIGLMVSKSLIN